MIINFGSINIDHVYRVHEMPAPGETIEAISYEKFLGGKGLNQSVAVARANGQLIHVGSIGRDGDWLLDSIKAFGVDCDHISVTEHPTGHAIILVDDNGENQIVLAGGANLQLTKSFVDDILAKANPDADWVLLQNETNLIEYIAEQSKHLGIKVAYSAAPFVPDIALALIDKIDFLAVNETEAAALATALGIEPENIPVRQLLITKGSAGAEHHASGKVTYCDAVKVNAVDTTGAGDTFLGSFLANYANGESIENSLVYASAASAIQVTKQGAAIAIPPRDEVVAFLKENSNQ